jgi:cytochrome c biogenesis protein CcmG, thiol:disulfide interchange protein DsbE
METAAAGKGPAQHGAPLAAPPVFERSSMSRNAITALVIIAVVAIVAVVLVVDRPDEPRSGTGASGSDGGPAALTGETMDGSRFDLADYRGKPVVVNFFASWCAPCNSEAPDLAEFARENPDVAFVGVDTGDKFDDGTAFAEKYGLGYPMVFDPDWTIASAWGVDGIPTTVFLDPSGVERDRIVGAAGKADFEQSLQSVQ